MDKQNELGQVWAWLSPVLAEDMVYQDGVQRIEVNGRCASLVLFTK